MKLRTQPLSLLTVAVIACGVCGCGLKGPLELPERPTNIVIRPAPGTTGSGAPGAAGPGSTAPATAPGQTTPAGETPATPAPAKEEPERLPPPELPRGQRGGVAS